MNTLGSSVGSSARTRPFVICIHDGTPAYARETRAMLRDLAPLVGRRLSLGVVPNWNGEWHLTAHPEYCRLVRENCDETLLHGYIHHRRRGRGPTTWLVEGSDEMNGLDADETRRTLERGQSVFIDVFGKPARGFIAPAWQVGHVRPETGISLGIEYTMGFFSLEAGTGLKTRLTTWTWDCGRWGWLGHVGHGIGWLSQTMNRGVPVLAVHPRDLARGFWPKILRLTQELLDRGFEPTTPAALLEARRVEAAA